MSEACVVLRTWLGLSARLNTKETYFGEYGWILAHHLASMLAV